MVPCVSMVLFAALVDLSVGGGLLLCTLLHPPLFGGVLSLASGLSVPAIAAMSCLAFLLFGHPHLVDAFAAVATLLVIQPWLPLGLLLRLKLLWAPRRHFLTHPVLLLDRCHRRLLFMHLNCKLLLA